MSKKQGRVRNFIVQDVDLFLDVFERVLCREQLVMFMLIMKYIVWIRFIVFMILKI